MKQQTWETEKTYRGSKWPLVCCHHGPDEDDDGDDDDGDDGDEDDDDGDDNDDESVLWRRKWKTDLS